MWRDVFTLLYPDALRRTYRVPPEHFNKVPYRRDTVPDTDMSALVLPVPFAAPAHNVPPASQPSGGATPVHTVPPASQPSGGATPVNKVRAAWKRLRSLKKYVYRRWSRGAQPPDISVHAQESAAPVHNVPPGSQPSGSDTPVHNVSPASQQSNPSTQYSLWTQEQQPSETPVRVQESDFRDDCAQHLVLNNLQELGNTLQEPMFILSQVNFGDYLNEPSYAAAVKASQLPKLPQPSDLGKKYEAGDFDILLIHRRHGVLVGELKSVGSNQPGVSKTPAQADDDVARRVGKAVKQLDKSEAVVKHLVSDIVPGLTVRKTLFLPYVSSSQLQRVLTAHPQLKKDVCRCLGAGNAADAVQLCCCSNQLSDPATYWDVTPAVLSQLTTWWQRRVTCILDTNLTNDLYLEIVARFVGPATSVSVHCDIPPRVEVRTVGEAVSELGRQLARLVLTPQQLDLMQRDPPLVFLNGPPGTGKTIMLVLQGLRQLRQGRDVDIVSVGPSSLAANAMIQHQLHMTLLADPSASLTPVTVRLHQYNFAQESDVDRAVRDLLSSVRGDRLYVLMDEATEILDRKQGLKSLVIELTGRVQNLHLWAASVFHSQRPPALQEEVLTTPLRSAPAVLREVGPEVGIWSNLIHPYSDSGLPAPGDGPSVVQLTHDGNAHTGRDPTDCEQCGKDVAAELRRLGVGSGGRYVTNSPASLAYRDVFVLTADGNVQDEEKDDAGNVTSPASGVVRGLRHAQIPMCVLERRDRAGVMAGWERRVADVAVAGTDKVTVAHWESVQGLERRVVVWLADWPRYVGDPFRLHPLSRCTTQLIIVYSPPDRQRH